MRSVGHDGDSSYPDLIITMDACTEMSQVCILCQLKNKNKKYFQNNKK
jgi:hypothetical protein